MASLFTLAKEVEGKRSVLNGKVFIIKINEETNKALFVDIPTLEPLWITSPVIQKEDDGVTLKIYTENSIYVVVRISSLLPTHPYENNDIPKTVLPADLKVLEKVNNYKPIHYGNGFNINTYTFNQPITKDQFIEFIKSQGELINTREDNMNKYPDGSGYYLDYAEFDGELDKWTHKVVNVYTD